MSDRLEDFVRQNREQFDLREPDPSIWLKINPANISADEGAQIPALAQSSCSSGHDFCRLCGRYILPYW